MTHGNDVIRYTMLSYLLNNNSRRTVPLNPAAPAQCTPANRGLVRNRNEPHLLPFLLFFWHLLPFLFFLFFLFLFFFFFFCLPRPRKLRRRRDVGTPGCWGGSNIYADVCKHHDDCRCMCCNDAASGGGTWNAKRHLACIRRNVAVLAGGVRKANFGQLERRH